MDLPQEPLVAEGRGELGEQRLERHRALVLDIVGELHRGHPAVANFALEAIAVRQRGAEGGRDVVHVGVVRWAASRNASKVMRGGNRTA